MSLKKVFVLSLFILVFASSCDLLKMIQLEYDPSSFKKPVYDFDTAPVIVFPGFNLKGENFRLSPYYVGRFSGTFGTKHDKVFARESVSDMLVNALKSDAQYRNIKTYSFIYDFDNEEINIEKLLKEVKEKFPDADLIVTGKVTKFWVNVKSTFFRVRVNTEVEIISYVIDVKKGEVIYTKKFDEGKFSTRQYVGTVTLQNLLNKALLNFVADTMHNPKTVEFLRKYEKAKPEKSND